MKEFLPNIYAFEVPQDAINFEFIESHYLEYKSNGVSNYMYLIDTRKNEGDKLSEITFKILGTVTPAEIDFDVEPVVELDENSLPILTMYKDYSYEMWPFNHPEGSFRSALTAAGITQYDKLVMLRKI